MSATKQLEYDATVLQEFAKRLYRQADNLVGQWIFLGVFFGIFGGVFLSKFLQLAPDHTNWTIGGLFLFCGFCGYSIGSGRAFKLRLEAQHVLCQVAIERNTRLPGRMEPQAHASKPTDEERGRQPAPNGHGVFIG